MLLLGVDANKLKHYYLQVVVMAGPILVAAALIGVVLVAALVFLGLSALSKKTLAGAAYVINGSTSHVRFLPTESRHSFTYPTLSLLVSLRDLEVNDLDLGWRRLIFAYAPKSFALTALSPDSYLQDDSSAQGMSMTQKLYKLLDEREMRHVSETLGDIWTMTMPSFLGFAGVNPLTVHFCYHKDTLDLLLVVLEVFHSSKIVRYYPAHPSCSGAQHLWGEARVSPRSRSARGRGKTKRVNSSSNLLQSSLLKLPLMDGIGFLTNGLSHVNSTFHHSTIEVASTSARSRRPNILHIMPIGHGPADRTPSPIFIRTPTPTAHIP